MKNTLLNKLNKLPLTSCGKHNEKGEHIWVTGQEEILSDAKRYIEATNEGRLFAIVRSVARSGESRVIDFGEFVQSEKASDGKIYGFRLNFIRLFEFLGYKYNEDNQGYRISGVGMDMIFHVHDTIIQDIIQMGVQADYFNLGGKQPIKL